MTESFSARLTERLRSGMGPVVVGLDPRLDALPTAVAAGEAPARRIAAFYRAALPALARHVPAVKPNIAFYERYGAAGFAAYEETCRLARELGLLVIGDIKRGDIGSTAAAYADIHLDLADAVTLQPYLGVDALEPFWARCRDDGKAVFVLVRTSNPSAADFQDLRCGEDRLCDAVARAVHEWGEQLGADTEGYTPVGAVVGATRPADIAGMRAAMPRAWLLLPGVGAQGAGIADCAAAFDHDGLGGIVNQSRGVMQCFEPADPDWLAALERAAASFSKEAAAIAGARTGSSPS